MKTLIICGDRDWTNYRTIHNALLATQLRGSGVKLVVSGGCRGADKIAVRAASSLGIPTREYPAKWKEFGLAAGPIRNGEMLKKENPDEVWAFHNCIEKSKGTKDMVNQAKAANVPVRFLMDK